jgi:hypothetical protein
MQLFTGDSVSDMSETLEYLSMIKPGVLPYYLIRYVYFSIEIQKYKVYSKLLGKFSNGMNFCAREWRSTLPFSAKCAIRPNELFGQMGFRPNTFLGLIGFGQTGFRQIEVGSFYHVTCSSYKTSTSMDKL